jgi:hypothetical protein
MWSLDELTIEDTKPAYGFSVSGELVKILPYLVWDGISADAEINFSADVIEAEKFAAAVDVSDGYAEKLAKILTKGLAYTLDALRKRRERIKEVKEAAERITAALS